MLVASLLLTEKPDLDKYTIKDILYEIDPIRVVDTINIGTELKKQQLWSDHFITNIVTSPTQNKQELRELFIVMFIFQKALPNFVKSFWIKDGESLAITYPFLKDSDNINNFMAIKSEIIRNIQFQMTRGILYQDIVNTIKEYSKLLFRISEDEN